MQEVQCHLYLMTFLGSFSRNFLKERSLCIFIFLFKFFFHGENFAPGNGCGLTSYTHCRLRYCDSANDQTKKSENLIELSSKHCKNYTYQLLLKYGV